MPTRSRNRGIEDINRLAVRIVESATQETIREVATKNPAAVELGRLGGLKGGPARARRLTARRRQEIAKKAAVARWKRAQTSAPP